MVIVGICFAGRAPLSLLVYEVPLEVAALFLVAAAATPLFVKSAYRLFRSQRNNSESYEDDRSRNTPFVSVHIAAYDEPSALVIQTLEALSRLDYPADCFEVIVLDNNTPDEATWKPVQRWCEQSDLNFRHFHFDGVQGAKAGALNLALDLADKRTRAVAVVDADYLVRTSFLKAAVGPLFSRDLSHVQFPQSYRGVTSSTEPLAHELGEYFESYAVRTEGHGDMLLTGTLSVISKDFLDKVGGWQTDTITEDADLGAQLLNSGGAGAFFSENQGSGILPFDFRSLSQQRYRWSSGNAQTLLKVLLRQKKSASLGVYGQLTAWLDGSLFLLPILLIALALGLPNSTTSILLGGALMILAVEVGLVGLSYKRRRLQIMLTRLALLPEHALGMISGFCGMRLRFKRTSKVGLKKDSVLHLRQAMTFIAFSAGFAALLTGSIVAGLTGFMIASIFYARDSVSRRLLENSVAHQKSQPATRLILPLTNNELEKVDS